MILGGLGRRAQTILVRWSNSYTFSKSNKVCYSPYAHFFHHPPAVQFNRLLDNPETRGDLLIQQPRDNISQNFLFARRQFFNPLIG